MRRAEGTEVGTVRDNVPFAPIGQKLASIAWRTWVYTDTGPTRTRFGYLRAGAIVDRREPPIVNEGCPAGWYRINPRGFVCMGKGATLDVADPIVRIASIRPVRGRSLPYAYALADDENPPYLYFRLPSAQQAARLEGENMVAHAAAFRQRISMQNWFADIGGVTKPPEFLERGQPLVTPYGVAQRLHYELHSGRATPGGGFALTRVFERSARLYALTTEHEIVALDRTRVVKPSEFHGVELGAGEGLPVAFVEKVPIARYLLDASGQMRASGSFAPRRGIALTGVTRSSGVFWQARDGSWLATAGVRMLLPRKSFPSYAVGDRKWIDVSINQQALIAYEGNKAVYATLVSTGRGGMGDPNEVPATVRGTFMIYQKEVSSTMDGSEDRSDGYALKDVPFVQYFHKGYALHAAYWHDEFGKIRSHGCINLAPIDAAWLFEWTDPNVPPDWHGVINKERGTVVTIHA